MHEIYPDDGLVPMLVNTAYPSVKIDLWINDIVPTLASVAGDFTWATFPGYATANVPLANFTTTGVISHIGYIQATPVSFTPTATDGSTVYGYVIWDSTRTYIFKIVRLDTPQVVTSGVPIVITPTLSNFSQWSS